ncbi:unnamed protein product [Closterium sp. NIES-64]|nr:unnamed protein product [Closterium sp. NIES-64]
MMVLDVGSGCGQWMWSVDVVSGCGQWMWSVDVGSGCGQWMWSVDVVSGCGQWMWAVDVGSGCGQWMWAVDVGSGCGQWMWVVDVGSGCGWFLEDVQLKEEDSTVNMVNVTRWFLEDLQLKEGDSVVVKMDIEGHEWAILQHWLSNPRMAAIVDELFVEYGLRPDRSTVGRILKSAERWAVTATGDNQVRRRGGAWPELEQAMARWIANAGPAGVPLTLHTIRDHVATMARNMGIPPTFRYSIGWVRRALRLQGVRCRAAQGKAASADMAAVRHAREKLPQLLTHLGVTPRDTFNLDETALWLSVLPRRTYSNGRIPGRKVSKERLTVAFLVNADGSHVFRPLVIN